MKRFRIIIAIVLPVLVLAVSMNTILTYASPTGVFTVTNVNDSGPGSLRQAILDANDTGGHDTIEFNLPASSTIVLGGTQLPVISDTLTIDGSTAVSLTISGNNQSRVLEVGAGANFTLTHLSLVQGLGTFGALLYVNDDEMNNSVVNVYNTYFVGNADAFGRGIRNSYGIVTIQDSIIRNNLSGGGIYNSWGTMTLDNTVIENNDVSYGKGGGIYNQAGTLNVHNSVVRANYAEDGGGIYNAVGTVVINNSIIDNNAVKAYAGYGGGIYTVYGIVTITHSTIISNFAGVGGGGIYLGGSLLGDKGIITIEQSSIEQNLARDGGGISIEYGLVNINRSMISNNSADSLGGGINNSYRLSMTNSTLYSNTAGYAGGGLLVGGRGSMINSTVSGNQADVGGGISGSGGNFEIINTTIANNIANIEGGGIQQLYNQYTAKNSIILNNSAPTGIDCEIKAEFLTAGRNLFGDGTGCPTGINDLTSKNPASELNLIIDDNGGATLTHNLVPGSQAFDAALDCTDTLGYPIFQDQRGAPRPNGGACDIGAVESGDFWNLYLPTVLKK